MAEVHSIEIKVDSTQAQTASQNLQKMANSAGGAESAIKNLARAAIGLVALDKLKDAGIAAVKMADSYTEMSTKLRLATGSQEQFNKAQTELFKIAQDNKAALGDTVQLYSRLSVGMREMGQTQAQTLKMVDSVSKALRISGASASESASVITQFGQALGSGVLRGEEFNAIMENGSRLARALADGLGVPVGALRKLAEQGQLTGDIVVKAIQSQTDALDREAQLIQTTVSQAFVQLENAAIQYIGEADKANGTTADLSAAIQLLAQNFNDLADPIAAVISTLAKVEVGGWLVLTEAIKSASVALQEMVGIQQAGTADPETLKFIKMGKGQMSIDELAGKQAQATGQAVAKSAKATGVHLANTSKAAKKTADDAQAAFEATIQANIKAAENAAKIQDAIGKTAKMRMDNELAAAEQKASLDMKEADSYDEKLKISEDLLAKQKEIITAETNLRLEAQAREEEILAKRISGIEQEIESAQKYNLTQSERIRLQTELDALKAQQQIMPEERMQIQLEATKQLADETQKLNELRSKGESDVREEALRTLEVLSSNLEFAREMANGLSEAFGEIGDSIGGLTIALAEYEKQSATIEIARKEAIDKAKGDQKKIEEINQDSAGKQARAQIKLYGDMTQAAQGFFKKGTKGYEAMGAAVKVFRVFEMAQSAMAMGKQIQDMGTVLAQFLGMETAKTTAKQTSNAQQAASDATGAVVSGQKAVADASQGDPYTGIIRGAAMLAFLAAIGIAIGGGGGGSAAAAPIPDTTGMGTVKGDPMAISESISKSLAILEENSSNDLNYSAAMLEALLAIKDSLGGVADLVATDIQPLIGGLVSQFGSDAVKQAGFLIGPQRLNKVLESGLLKGQVGARIENETSMLGVTIKKGQTLIADYDKKIAQAFGSVVQSIVQGVTEIGKVIGVTDKEILQRLNKFKVNIGKIDIAGLSSEEAAKKIEAAFSAMSDTLAMKALPEFKEFQRVGEGYMETITRVAEGINRSTGELERLGFEAINYADIENKRGDVAAEVARQTIIAQSDLGEGAKKYVDQLTGSLEDIIDSYKKLAEITRLINAVGLNGDALDRSIVNAAGGLDELQSALEDYYDRFLNDQEKVQAQTERLQREFANLGIAMPKTNDDFRKLLGSLDLNSEAGKKLFGRLIGLSGAFADLTDAIAEQEAAAQEAAKQAEQERKRLEQERLSTLQKAIDDAFSAMQKAYQDLTSIQDRFIKLSKSLRSYMDELVGPASQTISPEQRYFLARQEFERIRSLAGTGNEEAVGALAAVSKTFLDASRNYNASSEAYQSDLAMVVAAVEASTQYADDQVTLAQQSMDIAKAQYDRLGALNGTMGQVNSSVLSVNQGIANMNIALANYAAAVSSKQAELTAQLAAANAAAAAAQAAAAQAANTSNATPMPRPTYTGISATPVAFGPASPATGYSPSSSKYKWGYAHAYNMANFYYEQLLNRQAEEGARQSIANQLSNAYMSEAQIVAGIRSSPEYQGLIARGFVPGFAKGGAFGPGLAMVGEQGPEMVSFNGSGHVSSAGATSNFFSSIRDAINITSSQQTELLKEQVSELQALVRLQSAANRELINQLSEIRTETAESTRIAKVEASA